MNKFHTQHSTQTNRQADKTNKHKNWTFFGKQRKWNILKICRKYFKCGRQTSIGCNHIFLEWQTKIFLQFLQSWYACHRRLTPGFQKRGFMLHLFLLAGSIAKDCLFCLFDPSYLLQSHLFANLVALVRAEKLVDSHVTHVGVAKSGLFAVDARVGQAELVAALHPLKVHHHQKATWEDRKCLEWLPVTGAFL